MSAHRILYKGAGVALRTRSATAIKRYSAETGSTFDVSTSAAFPGNVSGTVQGTHKDAGLWSVSGKGFAPEQAAYVCEGVSAVLEARCPSMGLQQVGDLLERRRGRFAPGGVRFDETPQSLFISGVGYDRSALARGSFESAPARMGIRRRRRRSTMCARRGTPARRTTPS
jgi:hypothetical protein